ncbi:MAG: hypothetical protein U0271_16265 [Polyangiaceae bacterium]
MSQRIAVYALPQAHDVDACAGMLAGVLARLTSECGLSLRLTTKGPLHNKALGSRADCAQALAAHEESGVLRDSAKTLALRAYVLRFTGVTDSGVTASMEIACGIDKSTGPIWRGNRVELDVAPALDRKGALAALTVLAREFAADWGFVGSRGVPSLRPMGRGGPAVGWLTFLSQRYGAVGALPSPAALVPIDGGVIVLSQPAPFEERRARDLNNVEAVRKALGDKVAEARPLPFAQVDPTLPEPEPEPVSRPSAPVAREPQAVQVIPVAPPSSPLPFSSAPPSSRPPSIPIQEAPPPVSRPRGPALDHTVPTNVMSPFATGRAPLPFVATPAATGAAPVSEASPPSSQSGMTVAASDSASASAQLPFVATTAGMTFEEYIEVSALLRFFPQSEKDQVLLALGCAPDKWTRVRESWLAAIQKHPSLLSRFHTEFETAWQKVQADKPTLDQIRARAGRSVDSPPNSVRAPSNFAATQAANRAEPSATPSERNPNSVARPGPSTYVAPGQRFTLAQYVSLHVELESLPQQRVATLHRYGLSGDDEFSRVAALWNRVFQEHPDMHTLSATMRKEYLWYIAQGRHGA